jgi:soluble lytic murein transglycosylase-like protein
MSVDAVLARVQELESLVRGPAAAPAASPGTTTPTFAAQLATAQSAPPTATAASASAGVTPFAAEIQAAASRHGIDPALLTGLIRQESNFNPQAQSGAGARGLTQLMPGTVAGLGVADPFNPAQAIEGGAKYLRQMLDEFDGDPAQALAAYNAGPGAVARFGGVPPYAETQNYVRQVQAYAEQYRGSSAAATPATAAIDASALAARATPASAAIDASALAARAAMGAATAPRLSAPIAT